MKPSRALPRAPGSAGFTLVELAVVVVIIGVLASFAVPRFMASMERSKAAEAFNFLSTVHSAQERYIALQGTYANNVNRLDVTLGIPQYFIVGAVQVPITEASLETGWELALTRALPASGFGMYQVVFNQQGYDPDSSTIDPAISPISTGS